MYQTIQEAGIHIRKMRTEDLNTVLPLERACFSRPWSEHSFLDAICSEQALYLIAEAAGVPVGYCGFFFAGESSDLCNMLVEEQMRKQGIGEMLLKEGFGMLKEKQVEMVFLEVRASNMPAILLYRKLGFEEIGIRRDYYEEPKENAILMSKNLFPAISTSQKKEKTV